MKIHSALLLLALFALSPFVARAEALDCSLEHREDAWFGETLPEEVTARIRCRHSQLKLKDVYVARLKSSDHAALTKWFKAYEKSEAPGAKKTVVVEKKGSGFEAWLELESTLDQSVNSHFVFTAPADGAGALVFLYTDSKEGAQASRGTIRDLRRAFLQKDYLASIVRTASREPAESASAD